MAIIAFKTIRQCHFTWHQASFMTARALRHARPQPRLYFPQRKIQTTQSIDIRGIHLRTANFKKKSSFLQPFGQKNRLFDKISQLNRDFHSNVTTMSSYSPIFVYSQRTHMRKFNSRLILLIILAIISVSSHWYLNTDAIRQSSTTSLEQFNHLQSASEKDIEEESPKPVLPDVMLLKKVVETGRRLIPAN